MNPDDEKVIFLWHERIIRLEEKNIAAEKALELARQTLSITSLVSVLTILLSVISLIIVFIKK